MSTKYMIQYTSTSKTNGRTISGGEYIVADSEYEAIQILEQKKKGYEINIKSIKPLIGR